MVPVWICLSVAELTEPFVLFCFLTGFEDLGYYAVLYCPDLDSSRRATTTWLEPSFFPLEIQCSAYCVFKLLN